MTLQQMKYIVSISEKKSFNKAAQELFVSQSSLSASIKEIENELGIEIFIRTNRGILITPQGEELLIYIRQVLSQYRLLEDRFTDKNNKKKFYVSTQHYTFAVKAFIEMVKKIGMDAYEYGIFETKTYEILQAVKNFKSEIGVLYIDDFNSKVLNKLFYENNLEFKELFACGTFVYLSSKHPLASNNFISIEELDNYPCLSFDQGENNSFYLSEEVMSTYEYKKLIRVSDRATILNMMVGLNGYTLCSGIICEELNGDGYKAVPLKDGGEMRIGYVVRKGYKLSGLAELYIEELKKCNINIL